MVRDGSLHWPSLRFFLLQLHYDLFEIHLRWDEFSDFANLTTVEKMVLVLEDRRFFPTLELIFHLWAESCLKRFPAINLAEPAQSTCSGCGRVRDIAKGLCVEKSTRVF